MRRDNEWDNKLDLTYLGGTEGVPVVIIVRRPCEIVRYGADGLEPAVLGDGCGHGYLGEQVHGRYGG